MSAKRFGRMQRATAIVPLALLSAAWTASLAGLGPTAVVASSSSEQAPPASLPDGASVPTEAIEAPASVSAPDDLASGATGNARQIAANSSTNGIPSSALAAYQRAETVINSADKTCNLTWQLVAAIGRVESNHGRFGGNTLDDDGVAQPGIYGIALDGSRNTATIRDSDAGLYDNDTRFDRAVGPMQFIPSTWSVVGVDADNDGQRNPQDIDDAALASAVYLCSGNDDLSTVGGQRGAVFRYNNSQSYVDLVLSIMDNYLEGDFMSVPNGTTAAGILVPAPPATNGGNAGPRGPGGQSGGNVAEQPQEITEGDDSPSEPPATDGAEPGDNGDNTGGDGDNTGGDGPRTPQGPLPSVNAPTPPSTSVEPVDDVLTLAQATVQCTLDGIDQLSQPAKFEQCLADYTDKP